MGRQPRFHIGKRVVKRIVDAAERRRKRPIFAQYRPVQVDERHSAHPQKGAFPKIIAAIFFIERRATQLRQIPARQKQQRHVAASQPRIGENILFQAAQLRRRLPARQDRDRLPASAQQRRNAAEQHPKIAVRVVASGCDDCIRSLTLLCHPKRNSRIDRSQQINDITDQNGIFTRRFDPARMPAREHAQQIEKTDQRNITGHNHQYPLRRPHRRICARPRFEPLPFEHLAANSLHGPDDLLRQKPRIFDCGTANDLHRIRRLSERRQPMPQHGEYVDHAIHAPAKIRISESKSKRSLCFAEQEHLRCSQRCE